MIGILPITFLICIIWIFNHSKKLHDLSRYNIYCKYIHSYRLTWTAKFRVDPARFSLARSQWAGARAGRHSSRTIILQGQKNDRSFTRTTRTFKNNPIVLKKEQNAKKGFLKILERNGEERNGMDIILKEHLKSGMFFLLSRMCSKSGTHFKSGMYIVCLIF